LVAAALVVVAAAELVALADAPSPLHSTRHQCGASRTNSNARQHASAREQRADVKGKALVFNIFGRSVKGTAFKSRLVCTHRNEDKARTSKNSGKILKSRPRKSPKIPTA
jgi:hypothetical protein